VVVDGRAEDVAERVEGVRGVRVEGVGGRGTDRAVEADVDDRDVVRGDLRADSADLPLDEAQEAGGAATLRGGVVELGDQAAGDEELGDLRDRRGGDVEGPGDVRAGGGTARAEQAEDGAGHEVAASGGAVVAHRVTPLFTPLFRSKLTGGGGGVKGPGDPLERPRRERSDDCKVGGLLLSWFRCGVPMR